MVDRGFQVLLITATLVFSWLAMMAVHELGHVAHLWASGGTLDHVVLHPAKLSHTIPAENPHPLITVLGGPLWGVLVPLGIWAALRRLAPSRAYLAAFFAGFCLIANGAYLTGDAYLQGGDGRELVQLGMPPWSLVAAGLPLVAAGLLLWNGLGRHFGLGPPERSASRFDAILMTALAAILVVTELYWSRS